PNQVNNVLGFPYIFRGALDVRATEINEAMKLAAVHALAELTKDAVPDMVNRAYADNTLSFGRTYLIPKPLDPRLITAVSPAVAKAAMESGVARRPITDWQAYEDELRSRLGVNQKLLNRITSAAKSEPKRVVFAEGDTYKILKAAQILVSEDIARPILLGNQAKIKQLVAANNLDLTGCTILDISQEDEQRQQFAEQLFQKRQRKGVTLYEAQRLLRERNYYGSMMLESGQADAFITGLTKDYSKSIAPALRVIGVEAGVQRVASMYIIQHKKGPFFFADTTVNIDPTAEELVDIVGLTARRVSSFGSQPRVAMISYSNFGSNVGALPDKMRRATELAKGLYPDLLLDGEMQANTALNRDLMREQYPFSPLAETGANTLIFPNVESGNIAYKILQEIGGAEVIGPILMGMRKPVHILQFGASVREIVNMTAIAVVDAQK
ncbi:phosphate acyltransferase, partial [Hymenobacter mucosus]